MKSWIDVYLNHRRNSDASSSRGAVKSGQSRQSNCPVDGSGGHSSSSRGRRSTREAKEEVITLVIEDGDVTEDGHGYKEVSMSQLDATILMVIFKNLPLKNRIAVQRVNKLWTRLISSLWLSQKVLSFGYFPGLQSQSYKFCRYNSMYQMPGRTGFMSMFSVGRRSKKKQEVKSWPSILLQCINLTILDISSLTSEFQVKHFKISGQQLASLCPHISHFILTNDGVSMLQTYVEMIGINNNQIKTLEINSGWNSPSLYEPYFPYNLQINKKFDVKISDIIFNCPKLSKLYLDSVLPETLISTLPRVTHLHINFGSAIDVDLISRVKCIKKFDISTSSFDTNNEMSKKVDKKDILTNEMLSYLHITSVDISCFQLRELICNISNIETLHIKSYISNMKHLKGLKHLKELELYQSDVEPTTPTHKKDMMDSLMTFCTLRGRFLDKFSLHMINNVSNSDILKPIELMTNLKFLCLELHSANHDEEAQPTINLNSFPKLTTVKLTWVKQSDKQIKLLLKSNLRLKSCTFNYCNLNVGTTHLFVNYFFCIHPMTSVKVSITAKKSPSKRGMVKKIVRRSYVTIKYVTPFEPYYPNDWYLALV